MKKIYLGLDLGITYIGWSIVDGEQNIVANGTHLFKQLSTSADNNKYPEGKRGVQRRERRNKNRKKQRKLDFINMIDQFSFNNQAKLKSINKLSSLYKNKYQSIFKFTKKESASDFLFKQAHKYDLYEIYNKAFRGKINPKELFLFLYHKLSLRGVFYLKYQENDISNYSYEKSLFKNVLIKKYFNETNKFRKQSNLKNPFSIYWNWIDIEFILRKCTYIDNEFIEDYKKIFFRKRNFLFGPGSWKQLSPWGVTYSNKNPDNYLWNKKNKFCPISSVLNNNKQQIEKCINKFFLISEICNLISQLSLTKLNGEKLTIKQITEIINQSIITNTDINAKTIPQFLSRKKEDFSFFYSNNDFLKDNYQNNEKLKRYFNSKTPIVKKKLINIFNIIKDLLSLDKIRFDFILKYWEDQKNKNALNNKNVNSSLEEALQVLQPLNLNFEIDYKNFINFNDITEFDFNSTSPFGWKAYELYLNNFLKSEYNEQFLSINEFYKKEIEIFELKKYNSENKSKYFPTTLFDSEEFLTPNVKKTFKETIKLINNILRKYIYKNNWKINSLVIKTTYEKDNLNNSISTKKIKNKINEYYKFLEKESEKAKIDLEYNKIPITEINIKKYILWNQQENKDIYSGKVLLLEKIDEWKIDHIIPCFISFNNNLENLVVTTENKEDTKTPFEFFDASKFSYFKNELWYSILSVSKDFESNENKFDSSINMWIKKMKFKFLTLKTLQNKNHIFLNMNFKDKSYSIKIFEYVFNLYLKIIKRNKKNKINNQMCEIFENFKIETINYFWLKELHNLLEIKKFNFDILNYPSYDASIIAIYFSMPIVNEFQSISNKKRNKKQKIFRLIKNNILSNKQKFIKQIFSSTTYYSFPKYKLDLRINKSFYKKSIDEQWKIINEVKPKQIFNNENYIGYKEMDNKKYQLVYLELLNDTHSENVFSLFKELEFNLMNGTTIAEYCKKKKILTDVWIIEKLYLLAKENLQLKNNCKKKINIFKNINKKLVDEFNLFENLNLIGNNIKAKRIFTEILFNNLLKDYVLIIKNNNIIKLRRIKLISNNEYIPTFELINKAYNTKSMSNKYIFDKKYQKILAHNQTLLGDTMKMIAVLKFKNQNNKEKIEFFKVNQLNKIIRAPDKYEIIKFIDPNIWYLYKGEVWKISNLAIAANQLFFSCVSNFNIKDITKTYTSGNWGEYQELFNKIMRIKE